MKLIATLILFLTTQVFAQSIVSGEGRFYAADDDSLTFVKTQLHYQAVRDIISKELKNLGLDEKVFWQKYDEKFKDSFAATEQSLKEKYADESGEIPANKKSDFDRAVRAKRLASLSRFGRLQGILNSYSVKRMTRSPQSPQSRYYLIEGKTDRRFINELYLRFTSNDVDQKYKTLFITANFKLDHMTWSDAGVEVGSDFTDVVKNHWLKYIQNKFAGQIEEVVFTDESLERELRDFLMIPRDLAFHQKIEEGDSSLARFASGLWLKVEMDLDKINDDELLNKRKISVGGDLLMIELKTNHSIAQEDLETERKLFYTEDSKSFSSSLASMVYSKPLPAFEVAHKSMSGISKAKHDYRLHISSLSSIQDLVEIGDLLVAKGVVHQAKTEVVGFNGSKGELSITFRGNRENLQKFLRGITGSNTSSGKVIQVNPEKPTEMTLMLIEQQVTPKSSKASTQG